MLAIDYSNRKKTISLASEQHANDCVLRLHKHLKERVVLDESFSSVMTLFIVAITPINTNETLTQEQSQAVLIDSLITSNFPHLASEAQQNVRLVFEKLLDIQDTDKIMDLSLIHI